MSAPFSILTNPLSQYSNLKHYIEDKDTIYHSQAGIVNKTYFLENVAVLRRLNSNGRLLMKPFVAISGFRVRCAACTESCGKPVPNYVANLEKAFVNVSLRSYILENQLGYLKKNAGSNGLECIVVPKYFYYELSSGQQLICPSGTSLEFQKGLEIVCHDCTPEDLLKSPKTNEKKQSFLPKGLIKQLIIMAIGIYITKFVFKGYKYKNLIVMAISLLLWRFM